jgi:glycine/D-amino acid oxidase-like deaminating enzyme
MSLSKWPRIQRRVSLLMLQSPICQRRPVQSFSNSPTKHAVDSSARRIAVIGGGFAGVATAWHLLQCASSDNPIELTLFDAYGIAAGGSGAAAGLLHPFTPRGKVLWRGMEAFEDALKLVEVAERAASDGDRFVWRHGLLRKATSPKQAADFSKLAKMQRNSSPFEMKHSDDVVLLTMDDACRLVPGLALSPEEEDDDVGTAAMLASRGLVLHPGRYLKALWQSCQTVPYGHATLHVEAIKSLEELTGEHEAVVVAAGAAVGSVQETQPVARLLDLCQGYSLEMCVKGNESTMEYPHGAPSLLGSPYIAMQGTTRGVIGATQQHNVSDDVAWNVLGPGGLASPPFVTENHTNNDAADIKARNQAIETLQQGANALWPPLATGWKVERVSSGVRALPPRTMQGSIPLAGRLPSQGDRQWWLIAGLGARGLVYHAWLGRLLAQAVITRDEGLLPSELLRWKNM